MPPKAGPRLPLAPLLKAAGVEGLQVIPRRSRPGGIGGDRQLIESPITRLADMIGVSRRNVHRWQRDGVPEAAADRAALAIGLHPCEVWGDAWWDLAATA